MFTDIHPFFIGWSGNIIMENERLQNVLQNSFSASYLMEWIKVSKFIHKRYDNGIVMTTKWVFRCVCF